MADGNARDGQALTTRRGLAKLLQALRPHLGLHAQPLSTARAQAPPITLELFPAA